MREISKLKEMMDKWDDEFHKIFNCHVNHFVGFLVCFGVADFDILKFDKHLQKLGYSTKKDGSMNDYITKRWGTRACELIEELISAK